MGKPVKHSDQGKAWNHPRFSRNKGVREKRKYFLIVCEGQGTEPIYFEALKKTLPQGVIVVTKGTGRNTLSLVKEADEIREREEAKIRERVEANGSAKFDEVWAVFDKDSFPNENFDNAVHSCASRKNPIKTAWSNECFELWYLLHFRDQQTGIGRDDIFAAMETEFSISNYRDLKGEQGRRLHEQMAVHQGQATAMERARALRDFWQSGTPPSQQNPCTKVCLLVKELNKYKVGRGEGE